MTENLADNFRGWGQGVVRRLPIYGRIALGVGDDPDVRDLLLEAPAEQRQPVLLFAVVHYLLLGGTDHRLARWYPTVRGGVDRAGDPYPDFRDFVLGRRAEVVELLATRNTQTNEVGRGAVLRPAWGEVAEEVQTPLGLVELGASAGLNLLLDRWAFSYVPDGPRFGDPARALLIEAALRDGQLPPLGPLPIGSRIGIDLQPIDVRDDQAVQWLLACVWPEDLARFHRLRAAIDAARTEPPQVIAGDLVESLPSVAARIPAGQHLAVQNSWVLNYLPAGARTRLVDLLSDLGETRDLSWLSLENPDATPGLPRPPRPDGQPDRPGDKGATVAVLTTWRSGHKRVRRVADCHPHGTWLRWW